MTDDGVVVLTVPSYLIVTTELAENALPVTVTMALGKPLVGLRFMNGEEGGAPAGGQNDPDEHITAVMVVADTTEIVL